MNLHDSSWTFFFFFLAVAVTFFHFFTEPWRWAFAYLHGKSNRSAALNDAFFSTALASYLLPFKLGVPLRLVILKNYCKLETRLLVMIIFVDGALSIACWSVLTLVIVWLAAIRWSPPPYVFAIGVFAVVVIASVIILKSRATILTQLREVIDEFDHPLRRILKAGIIIVGDIASYGARHALLLVLFTHDVSLVPLGAAAGIVATFAGIISGLPLGLIGYDATLIAVLSIAGIEAGTALEIIVMNRALNIVVAMILGVPASLRLGLGTGIVSVVRKLRELSRAEK